MRLRNAWMFNGCRVVAGLLVSIAALYNAVAQTNPAPRFDAVYKLLQEHATGVSAEDLNAAAVRGILSELEGRALLVTNGAVEAAVSTNLVAKTNLLDESYAYLRVGQVAKGLAADTAERVKQIASTNKLKGVILDLRFAEGNDYAEAAQTADLFVNKDQPLLQWSGQTYKSTVKNTAVTVPCAILVNSRTRGAAEALAAALREAKVGLVIGGTTAGQASVFEDFPLGNGQTQRIASSPVKAGSRELGVNGVEPDIQLDVSLENERAYLEDPYQVISSQIEQVSLTLSTNEPAALETNRPRARINEAELVRRKRQGLSEDELYEAPLSAAAELRVIRDPALARALDLLKGLSVIRASR